MQIRLVTLFYVQAYFTSRREVKRMLIKRLILAIGVVLIITGILLIATSFPISIIGPLLIAAGLILVILSVYTDRCKLLGIVSILLGILVVIAAVAIFVLLSAALLVPYVLLFLGLALIVLGLILLNTLG
jgi:hypothetical protein